MDESVELPPGVDLLWGRRSTGTRGPKAGLSVEAIVAAAIDIANADGLDAVSMAKVAKAVGFTTMSLYRHVTSKEELLQLMWNASANGIEDFELSGESWRDRLMSWAMAQRDAIERNIWIVQMPMATPPLAPNSLRWIELGLEALDGTGLGHADQLRLLGLISSHALIDGRMGLDQRKSLEGTVDAKPIDYAAVVRELADEERFPRLHQAVWSGEVDDTGPGGEPFAEFRFDIAVILDGVESLIARP